MVVTVGGIPLLETRAGEQEGGSLRIGGRQSYETSTAAAARAAHDSVTQMAGLLVPVVFDGKAQLTGFYRVTAASSRLSRFADGAVEDAVWSLTLERLGSGRDVEIESRIPAIARTTDHAVAPVFWHAPAVGFSSYYTGTANPAAYVVRQSADGPVTAQLGIPTAYAPRWTVTAADYLAGSARVLFDGIRRVGTHTPPHTTWQVDNGLVRLSGAASGGFTVAAWGGAAWESAKTWQLTIGGTAVTTTPEVTVLRNDPEEVVARLSYPTTPNGRVTVDLGLRRGSRFVTGVVKRHTAATLAIAGASADAGTAETGVVRATADDAAGNRYVIGSAKTFTANLTNGGVSKPAVTALDFFVGHAVGGATAVAGDTPADLLTQYLGSAASERATVVRR